MPQWHNLLNANAMRLERTLETLRRYRIELLAPCHCTGDHACALLRQAFPEAYQELHAGMRFDLG